MQPIHELLNKIKWDKRENPKQYSIFYFDRILKTLRNSKRISGAPKISSKFSRELIKIPYKKIKKIEGSFMVLDRLSSHEPKSSGKTNPEKMGGDKVSEHFDDEDETNVPLHRIKKVMKNENIVWERKL